MREIAQVGHEPVLTSLNELLMRDGGAFVRLAYLLILGREANPRELAVPGTQLHNNASKQQFLSRLMSSEEGRAYAVSATSPVSLALRQNVVQGLPASDARVKVRRALVRGWMKRVRKFLFKSRSRSVAAMPSLVLSERGKQIHASLADAFQHKKSGK